MKVVLFLVFCHLSLPIGQGAPHTAVYKFVKCLPDGDKANCVTHQSPELDWSPNLPGKLSAAAAQYLEAEPAQEDDVELEPIDEEEGSGLSVSSEDFLDMLSMNAWSESGSGESEAGMENEKFKDDRVISPIMKFLGPLPSTKTRPEEQELKEDNLLQF